MPFWYGSKSCLDGWWGCRWRRKHIFSHVFHWLIQNLHEPATLTKCWVARFRSCPPVHYSTIPRVLYLAACGEHVAGVCRFYWYLDWELLDKFVNALKIADVSLCKLCPQFTNLVRFFQQIIITNKQRNICKLLLIPSGRNGQNCALGPKLPENILL